MVPDRRGRAAGRASLLLGLAAAALSCGEPAPPADGRPSFLLVVLDTLRADAVSAYGKIEGTTPYAVSASGELEGPTPHLDALAAEGIRFARATAPAPWTIPSHATLFTGVGPERHRVGVNGRVELPKGIVTLAERLSAAGYETVGFSENPGVSAPFGLTRGFSHFESALDTYIASVAHRPVEPFDAVEKTTAWAERRVQGRPFFAFVNIMDPHDPYELHEDHRFLPPGTDPERARRLGHGKWGEGVADFAGICDRLPSAKDLAILRGLYLEGVASADTKLGAIRDVVAEATGGRRLVTIVTSDHGEHLGERRLLGHQFSLGAAVLRIPLVVDGVSKESPVVIDQPVTLEDVAPSILAWAGLEVPEGLPGRVLPTVPGAPAPGRELLAVWSDAASRAPEGWDLHNEGVADRRRKFCHAEDKVFGDILALSSFPFKLLWFENQPPELYDLRWDPDERSNVASHHPEQVARMSRKLEELHRKLARTPSEGPVDPRTEETLRALGYVE